MDGEETMKMGREGGRMDREGKEITTEKKRRRRDNGEEEGQRRSDNEGGEL